MKSFKKANFQLYEKFKQDLELLYINTFTKGLSAQHISKKEAEKYLSEIFNNGYGMFGFDNNQLISALLATPPSFDFERPEHLKKKYPDENSLYIAEVLVHENYRKQGLGQKLMQLFEDNLHPGMQHILLRVWKENTPAVALYEKMGFEICGEITQEKIRPNSKEKFIMHKNYMIKSY